MLLLLILFSSCQESTPPTLSLEDEKAAILSTLNEETKAAFQRDYQAWQDKWIHEDFVTKTYLNVADSTLTETSGWTEVDNFVKAYFEDHPEPAPLPDLLEEIDVRLYGSGAWVTYEQLDPTYGRKLETRLMEKREGQWKIAGMQTIIYGFEEE